MFGIVMGERPPQHQSRGDGVQGPAKPRAWKTLGRLSRHGPFDDVHAGEQGFAQETGSPTNRL